MKLDEFFQNHPKQHALRGVVGHPRQTNHLLLPKQDGTRKTIKNNNVYAGFWAFQTNRFEKKGYCFRSFETTKIGNFRGRP